MMLVPSKFLKNGANLVLVVVKVLNAYSHWAINDAFERLEYICDQGATASPH